MTQYNILNTNNGSKAILGTGSQNITKLDGIHPVVTDKIVENNIPTNNNSTPKFNSFKTDNKSSSGSTPKTHRVSLKNSLNRNSINFSKFEINILENNFPEYNLKKEDNIVVANLLQQNQLQIIFIVHKEGWKRKKRIIQINIII